MADERSIYRDRAEAGRSLAGALAGYAGLDPVVVGLPRGGVVVAAEIARALGCELDVIIAGKLRAPGNPELAIGAVTEDGRVWLNEGVAAMSGADSEYVEMEKESRLAMVRDRLARYRAVKEKVDLADRTVIIADDGLATGSTMTAAIEAASAAGAKGIIVAVPGGPADTVERIGRMKEVLRVLCPLAPTAFYAVSQLYLDFTPVEDDTVIELLKGFSD